jgi:ABC-type branched-subunit amino acid transport system substrate-binding protein
VPSDPDEAVSLRQGATLGLEHINQAPGPKARLIVRGRQGQWGTEGNEAAALALDESVAGIVTPSLGTAAHEILQVSGRTRVLVASLCADLSVTGTGVPWAVRIVPRNDQEACLLFTALPLRAGGGPSRWAALVPPDRAGREVSRDLASAAALSGCRLQEPVPVSVTNNLMTQIRPVLAGHPQAVLLWTEPRLAGQLARALRESGFTGQLAGPSRLRSGSFLEAAGPAADGLVVATAMGERQASSAQFEDEYRTRFGTGPDPLAFMAADAVCLLVEVLRQSGTELAYRSFPLRGSVSGLSGPIQFDASGNRIVSLTLLRCEGREFKSFPTDQALSHPMGEVARRAGEGRCVANPRVP